MLCQMSRPFAICSLQDLECVKYLRECELVTIPGEGFVDLHHWDFIRMAGCVSHCKLERLILGPDQMALLHQGVLRQNTHDEVESEDILMGMEYVGAVGMMVIDKLAEVNSRVSTTVDGLKAKTKELEWDEEDLDSRLEAEKEKVQELEERVVHLEMERHLLHQETSSAKAASSECVLQIAELMTEVWAMRLFQTVLQHGPGNPIVVEDDEVVEETEEEGSDFDGNQVVFLDVGRFSPVPGMLVPIVDEDLKDVARDVERRDEQEELR